ncbi:MAG: tyrosine-type recombinase/integrase, partial [Longimicrobiales bacterium]
RESRVYLKTGRYYGDFRDYSDVGGKREALVPSGAAGATTDPDVAGKLAAARVEELETKRRNRDLLGVEQDAELAPFAAHHLILKAEAGRVTDRELGLIQKRLERAVEFFGTNRNLAAIGVRDVERWAAALAKLPGQRGGTLSGQTVRHHLNALSNLYRRAQAESCVLPGFNPVSAMMDKPVANVQEAEWLEAHDASLFLEAARLYKPQRDDIALPCTYPLVAMFLLTGGRKSEVLGLQPEDVSFDRRTITFRPNGWRRLKTRTSHRVVPLWPQLEEILRAYVFGGAAPPGRLLFPTGRRDGSGMVNDLRKVLDALSERCGWSAGIRTKAFRHTYCAMRLQTLDRGAPVSPWTVAREMGHGGRSLVDRVYGHLGDVRHRSEVVEYHVDQHAGKLGDRLAALRAWARPRCPAVTAGGEPCPFRPVAGRDHCRLHAPDRKVRRRLQVSG